MRAAAVVAVVLLAGCAGGPLHDFDSRAGGPDEFSVIPMRPLAMPPAIDLPEPGGVNRADPDPVGDAMARLGGAAGAGPAGDAALIAHAGRHGTDPAIRATLAEEDAAIRRRSAIGGIFGGDRYFATYARQALDAYAELVRFRNLGVAVPSAPPGG